MLGFQNTCVLIVAFCA